VSQMEMFPDEIGVSPPTLSVVPFKPRVIEAVDAKVDIRVVDMLHEFHEMAAKGQLSGIAITAVTHTGSTITGAADGDNITLMIGAIERLKARLLHQVTN